MPRTEKRKRATRHCVVPNHQGILNLNAEVDRFNTESLGGLNPDTSYEPDHQELSN